MENEYLEYAAFVVNDKDGNEVEMAVVDEFEVDHKKYVAGARIIGDEISEEGIYIYRAKLIEDEIIAEKILDAAEYEKVVNAYVAMGVNGVS